MQSTNAVAKAVKRFEFMSQRVWPSIRNVSRRWISPRCSNCTISSKVPGIEIHDGICNKCRAHKEDSEDSAEAIWEKKHIAHQQESLDELLTSHQGKGKRRYDAFVVFSGGKDSTYILHRLKTEYPGLRVLAGTWNNGFYSPVALETASQVAEKLDIDHFVFKPRSSVFKSLYRYTLMHVDDSGSYGTVDRLDGTLNQHLGLRFAAEFEIPLMISGVDWSQALLMGSNTCFEHPREDLLCKVDTDRMERRSGFCLKEIFNEEDLALYWNGTMWPVERIPRFIMPLIAWRPNKEFIAEELSRAGLVLPAHTSPLLTNNEVLSIMTAIDIHKIGYCSFEPEFSDMIRLKRSDADYWRNVFEFVEFLVRRGWFLNKAFLSIIERLDLTKEDLGLA